MLVSGSVSDRRESDSVSAAAVWCSPCLSILRVTFSVSSVYWNSTNRPVERIFSLLIQTVHVGLQLDEQFETVVVMAPHQRTPPWRLSDSAT